MPLSASRRRDTSPSFWSRYNKAQDSLALACMPSLTPITAETLRDRNTRAVHPEFRDRKVYSA